MLSAPDLLELKAAVGRLVIRCGRQEACAMIPGMRVTRHQSFNDYGNPEHAERHVPLDVLATLEQIGGPEVTRVLAKFANCLLVPLPDVHGHGPVAESMGRSAKEFGDVLVRAGQALSDGAIDATEARPLLGEIFEAMLELARLAEAVKAAIKSPDKEDA
ncbi:MAG TPA: phage regulatory CII family protein [Bradyrhizobium sp.]|nr:phage regulatory CII family protein [Bradyrhizobium sp.]